MKTKTKIKEETLRVAYNFRRIRKQQGLKSKELAAMGKVTPAYITNIEKCVNGTSLGRDAREKWAKIFRVDVSEFTRPIDLSDIAQEVELLKQEIEKYSITKIRYLRSILPIILEGAGNEKTKKGTVM